MANVSRQSAEAASEQLTAIWNNFYDGSKNLEYYTDVMVKLGATTASSSDEIAQGVQKFASVAGTIGLSYEYAAAALATLTANTRESAEVVGNALKTLFSRIQGLKLGETLDDGTDLNKYSNALMAAGVNIKDVNDDLKNMDQILTETHNKWDTLSKDQQMALAQTVAGVRQYTQFVSLMENWEDMEENLNTAYNAEGALSEQAAIYAESWEAAKKNVRASAEEIYNSLVNPDFYIEVNKVISPFLSFIAKIFDSLGGMQGLLTTLSLLMNKVFGDHISAAMTAIATNLGIINGKEAENARRLKERIIALMESNVMENKSLQIKNNTLTSIMKLQLATSQYYDSLNPRQKELFNADLENLQLIRQQIEQQVELQIVSENTAEQYRLDMQDNIKETKNWEQQLNNIIQQMQSKKLGKLKIGIDTSAATAAFDSLMLNLGNLTKKSVNFAFLQNQMKQLGITGNNVTKDIFGLAQKLELLGPKAQMGSKGTQDFFNQVEKGEGPVKKTTEAIEILKQAAKDIFGASPTSIQQFISETRKAERAVAGIAVAEREFNLVQEGMNQKVQQNIYAMTNWAEKLVHFGTALGQLSMGINAMNTLKRAFTDDDIETTQRLTMVFTALSMLLPVLARGYKSLIIAKEAEITTEQQRIIVAGSGIAASAARRAALAAEARGESLLAQEIAATNAALAVRNVLNGAVIAAAAAFAIYKLIDYFNKAEERAAEAIAKANEELDEQVNKLEEINNELQSIYDRIEELEQLETPTLTEKEELKNLREQVALLERRKAIQEESERLARRQSIKTFIENYKTANQWVTQPSVNSGGKSFDGLENNDPDLNDPNNIWSNTEGVQQYLSNKEEEQVKDYISQLQTFEEQYLTTIQGIHDGIIEESQETINKIVEFIEMARQKALGKSKYWEIYIQPVIDDSKITGFFKAFQLEGTKGIQNLIDNEFKLTLETAGISEEGFLEYIQAIGIKANKVISKAIKNIDLRKEFIEGLSDEDIQLIARIQLDNINDFEDFYNVLNNLRREDIIINIQVNVEDALKTAKEALKTLAEGEDFLDEEMLKSLESAFAGFYDMSNLKNLSFLDQARAIGEAIRYITNSEELVSDAKDQLVKFQATYDEVVERLKINEEELNEYTTRFSSLNEQEGTSRDWDTSERELKKYSKTLKNVKELEEKVIKDKIIKVELEADISDITTKIEQLNNIELDPLEVEIANVDAVLGQMGALKKAASLIGEGFKVSAKNVEELMKTMPELFEDATVDMETGIVQLSQDIVNAVSDANTQSLNDTIEALQLELQARVATSQTELDILNQMRAVAEGNATEVAFFETAKANEARDNKILAAKAIIQAKISEAMRTKNENAQTASDAIHDQNQVSEASAKQGKITSDNWINAANNIGQALHSAFYKAFAAQKNFVNGNEIAQFTSNIVARNSIGFSTDKSTFSENYNIIDRFGQLRKFMDSGFSTPTDISDEEAYALMESAAKQLKQLGYSDLDLEDLIKMGSDRLVDYIDGLQVTYGLGETLVRDPEELKKDIAKGINDTKYELAETLNQLSRIAQARNQGTELKESGLKKDKDKSSKENKKELKDLEDIEDRYHKINRQIEQQNKLLDQTNEDIDRTYGIGKLKNYKKELEQLTRQQENYKEKLRQAQDYLKTDTANLESVFDNIEYDENGEILNYTKLLEQAVKDYNDAILTAGDEEAESLQKLYDRRIEYLKKYEETLDEVREQQEELDENAREIQDNKLARIEYRMEVVLDIKSLKDSLRNFDKVLQESFGDALTHGTGGMNKLGFTDRILNTEALNKQAAQLEADLYPSYLSQFNDFKQLYEEANNATDRQKIIEDIINLQGEVLGSAQAIVEWANTIEDIVPNAIAAASERFSKFTDQLEHNTSILDSIKEVLALQGVTYKTQQGFAELQRLGQEKLDAQVSQAQLQRKWYEQSSRELEEAQARLDSLNGDEGNLMYDTYKKEIEALQEQTNKAQEAMLTSAKEAMQTARDIYEEQIDKFVYDLDQKLSNGLGLDFLQEKYDHYIDQEEEYFDKVNQSYHTLSWYNKLQGDIDKTTDGIMKKHLEALQKEIDLRGENGKLNQYDLDILEAKYNILQAQAALEDAQNAKNEVKLVRDSQGNWNYQYVANQNEVENREQAVLDAQIEWYNIAKDHVKEITGDILQLWQDCEDDIAEVFKNAKSPEEMKLAEAKAAEIHAYYAEQVRLKEEEKQQAIKDMNEAGNSYIVSSAQIAGEDLVKQTGLTKDQIQEIAKLGQDDLLGLITDGTGTMEKLMNNNIDFINLFDNTYAKDLDNMTQNTDIFEEELEKTLDKAKDSFKEYGDKVQDVAEKTGTTQEELAEMTDRVTDANDRLVDSGLNAADTLWELIDGAIDAADAYGEMADKIWEAVDAMRALAEQSADYVQKAAGGETYDNLKNKEDEETSIKSPSSNDDISYKFAQLYEQGKNVFDPEYEYLWQQRAGKRKPGAASLDNEQLARIFRLANGGNEDAIALIEAVLSSNGEDKFHELVKKYIASFDTGGYTGDYEGAKLAFLHEKELVLNQEDTKNILKMAQAMRDIEEVQYFKAIQQISEMIDVMTELELDRIDSRMRSIGQPGINSTDINYNYHIDTIEFPGITDSSGLEEVFRDLPNRAAQWVRVPQ